MAQTRGVETVTHLGHTAGPAPSNRSGFVVRVGIFLRKLGPGLITGASDDDPSGIATYSQVGAQFGYGLLWTMWITYPLMGAMQEISARVGRVTGKGIAANLRLCYPKPLLYAMVVLVAVCNVFNLGADIGAMGAAAELLVPGPREIYIVIFGILSLALLLFVPYSSYVKYLKWLTISLFAYVGAAFFAHVSWRTALADAFLPHLHLSKEYWTALTAVLGTTISPYLFFWQASQEVEEVRNHHGEKPLKRAPGQAEVQIERIRMDTYVGMALSNLVASFIILTAGATLHEHGILDVTSAAQAARALEPLAGKWAAALFTCGILGTGLLAVPVLAGSAGYAIGETFKWRVSLESTPPSAIRFYSTLTAATVIGLALNFMHIDPMRALYWAAVLNGLAAGPLMGLIVAIARNRTVMGKFVISLPLQILGWAATIGMFAAGLGTLLSWKF
jgi:NRAMP (natural resistance-associated macrophage protein)-like metal ion transporter